MQDLECLFFLRGAWSTVQEQGASGNAQRRNKPDRTSLRFRNPPSQQAHKKIHSSSDFFYSIFRRIQQLVFQRSRRQSILNTERLYHQFLATRLHGSILSSYILERIFKANKFDHAPALEQQQTKSQPQ
jgi:hypothetical protein